MDKCIEFKPIYLPENKGLGNALREAVKNCTYSLIARMDSDDISAPDRFELQLNQFSQNYSLDIVGGNITEFVGEPNNITGQRAVLSTDSEIKKDMRKRCAMNHMAVMYKKCSVQNAGGYLDWPWNEDYYLWIRMIERGCTFGNIQANLVNVRTGDAMSARRGGWKYFKSEERLQRYMLSKQMISFSRYLYNVAIRFAGEVVATNSMRSRLFKFTRKEYVPDNSKIESKDNICGSKKKDYPPFSVSMCVYGGDKAEWFDTALGSVIDQTVPPDEIVLVVDGAIPESIQLVIDKYISLCNAGGGVKFIIIKLEKNSGHGIARRIGLENCTNEFIALMDSDDISVSDRFEKQLSYFEQNCELAIVGGNICEFVGTSDNCVGKRIVPESDSDIKAYMKKRCPMNQVTVMFRKEAVQDAGGYLDWYCNEDYYLWIRMSLNNQKFANIPEILVNVRVGKDMYARRGGGKYLKSEIGIQKFMLEKGLIDKQTYISNCVKRYILQKALPNSIRGWVFKKFARS